MSAIVAEIIKKSKTKVTVLEPDIAESHTWEHEQYSILLLEI